MIIVITGPTCSNKTHDAITLAKLFNGEIVNADAFQCYKELNIGVAKPSAEELSMATHHLFSFLHADEKFSIADYQTICRETIDDIFSRGKNVILVGGSGLYIRATLYDYKFNKIDNLNFPDYSEFSNEELHKKLEEIDVLEANKIHPNNRKRIIRALNIYFAEHKTKSEIIKEQNHNIIYPNVYIVSPFIERDVLYSRINDRVDKMFANGLLVEVKHLYSSYDSSLQSLQAIGYKEYKDVIDNKIDFSDLADLIKKHSRNYAKRQITFIKHQFNDVYYYKSEQELISYINKVKDEQK